MLRRGQLIMVATRQKKTKPSSSMSTKELEDKNGWVWATDITAAKKGYVPITYVRLLGGHDPKKTKSAKNFEQTSCHRNRSEKLGTNKRRSQKKIDAGRSRNKTQGTLYIAGPKPRRPPGHMSHAFGNTINNRVLHQRGKPGLDGSGHLRRRDQSSRIDRQNNNGGSIPTMSSSTNTKINRSSSCRDSRKSTNHYHPAENVHNLKDKNSCLEADSDIHGNRVHIY